MLNKNLVKFIFSLVLTLSLFYFLLKSTESGLTFDFFNPTKFHYSNYAVVYRYGMSWPGPYVNSTEDP